MSPVTRLIVVFVAFAVLIGGFLVARPEDEPDDEPAATAPAPTAASTTAGTVPSTPEPAPPALAVAGSDSVVVRGLKPVDGVRKIKVKKGETARFTVSSDVADTAHLHGYDIEKPVGPGKLARFEFEAKFDGIYELELEDAGVPVAELRVEP